jgi:hypothetical protein
MRTAKINGFVVVAHSQVCPKYLYVNAEQRPRTYGTSRLSWSTGWPCSGENIRSNDDDSLSHRKRGRRTNGEFKLSLAQKMTIARPAATVGSRLIAYTSFNTAQHTLHGLLLRTSVTFWGCLTLGNECPLSSPRSVMEPGDVSDRDICSYGHTILETFELSYCGQQNMPAKGAVIVLQQQATLLSRQAARATGSMDHRPVSCSSS